MKQYRVVFWENLKKKDAIVSAGSRFEALYITRRIKGKNIHVIQITELGDIVKYV